MLGGDEMETMKRAARDAFNGWFGKVAAKIAVLVGSPWAFGLAVGAIVVWAMLGPRYKYSDTWQLVINTGTTIVTFLMVFLIQNTQNRDAKAIHLKLDELLRGVRGARTGLVHLEDLSEEELTRLGEGFERVRARHASWSDRVAGGGAAPADLGGVWRSRALRRVVWRIGGRLRRGDRGAIRGSGGGGGDPQQCLGRRGGPSSRPHRQRHRRLD